MLAQLKQIWDGMPPRKRILLGGAGVAVFLLLAAVALIFGQGAPKEILFSRLDAIDAAEVLRQLDERGVRYELSQDALGRATIKVPGEMVYRTRIELAALGVPRHGSIGFELFDETQLGMTDDVRRINLRRAINGELERTIRALDVVEDARVQVAIPENRLFISQQQSPTAAVMLTLRPGLRLTQEQVRAIQRLVGATVEGLNPDDVFVVDNRGNPLSDQLSHLGPDGGLSSVEKQLLIQQALGNEYARQIRSMLEAIYGAGRVEAMVTVQLNFEMTEEMVKAFETPAGGRQGLVRSEQRSDESFSGTGAVSGGVPGVESNVPGYVGAATGGDSEFQRSESIINYELNQIETRRVIPPGAIKSVSAGVWIDAEIGEEQKEAIAATLSRALGLSEARGDQVVVEAVPFAVRSALAQADAATAEVVRAEIPSWWVIGLVALLALGLIAAVMRRRRAPAAQPTIDMVVGDEEDDEPLTQPSRERLALERRRQRLHEEIAAAAAQKPHEVAQLIKGWLTEE